MRISFFRVRSVGSKVGFVEYELSN